MSARYKIDEVYGYRFLVYVNRMLIVVILEMKGLVL